MTALDQAALAELDAYIEGEIEQCRSAAAQVAFGFGGEVVAQRSFGEADDSTRFLMFSATKPFVAMALLPLLDSGALDLMTPVADYLPGFGDNGKADVTVLHVVTMQGGFPQNLLGPGEWGTSEGRRAVFASWELAWPAGSRTEYHPVNAHWVIAELIETLTGRSYVEVVNELAVAAGGVALLGAPPEPPREVALFGELPADRAALATVFGRPDLVPDTTVGPEALLGLNVPFIQEAAIPGGGGISTGANLATIYQGWLHNTAGLPQRWLDDAMRTVRNASINRSDGAPANRTITGVLNGNDAYAAHRWMPADAPLVFGHAGAGGQLAWVDQESGVSFSFLHDRLHQNPTGDFTRCRDINRLAMNCFTR